MNQKTKTWLSAAGSFVGMGVVAATPTYAMQITALTSGLSWVQTTISGVGVVIIVIAIMWTGMKLMFQHAKWSEVAHILIGGILVGAAAAIGPQIFGGGTSS